MDRPAYLLAILKRVVFLQCELSNSIFSCFFAAVESKGLSTTGIVTHLHFKITIVSLRWSF